MRSAALLLLLLSFLAELVRAAQCFFPAGDVPSDRFPCDPDAETSVCCATGFYCLSNGLCMDNRYTETLRLLRGGCTDVDGFGGTGGCFGGCLSEYPAGDEAVFYCGEGKYCCNDSNCCNATGVSLLSLGEPSVTATVTLSDSAATPSTYYPSGSRVVSLSSAQATQTTGVPTGTPATSQSAVPLGHTNYAAIGIGVGIGAGVVLVAAIVGVIFFLRRRRKRELNERIRRLEYGNGLGEGAPVEDLTGPVRIRRMSKEPGIELNMDTGLVELPGERLGRAEMEGTKLERGELAGDDIRHI